MIGPRIPFVIRSCAGLYFFFLAARLYLRTPLAFFSASLLFATNTYIIASGRTAMETFAPITTTALAVAAILYARNRRGRFAIALAGAANGLLLIDYFSFRFVGLVNGLFFFPSSPRVHRYGIFCRIAEAGNGASFGWGAVRSLCSQP